MVLLRNGNGNYPLPRMDMISSVSARAIVVATFTVGLPVAAAYADSECGTGATVTCSDPSYPSGINYPSVTGLTLSVPNGTSVTDGIYIGVADGATGAFSIDIDAGSGTLTAPATPQNIQIPAPAAVQLLVPTTSSGNISASLKSGTLKNNGDNSGGIYMTSITDQPTSSFSVDFSGGSIILDGKNASGINVENFGSGATTLTMTGGTVTGASGAGNDGQIGVAAFTGFHASSSNQTTMTLQGGSITVGGVSSTGALAQSATGGGTVLTLSGTTISNTGGSTAADAQYYNGAGGGAAAASFGGGDATLTMSAGSVSTEGDYGSAIQSLISGTSAGTAMLIMTGGTVSTTGDHSDGALAANNTTGLSHANIKDGTISTEGDTSAGVHALGRSRGGSNIEMSGGTITTKGNNSPGLFADVESVMVTDDAKVDFYNGSITTGDASDSTAGTGSHGVYSFTLGSGQAYTNIAGQSQGDNPTVKTYGANAHGAYAYASKVGSAYAGMKSGTIETHGAGSFGLAAETANNDSEVDYTGGNISTLGDGAYGVYVTSLFSGDVTMNLQNASGQTLSTSGKNAYGAYALAGSGAITISNTQSTITTAGDGSHGIAALISGNALSSDITLQSNASNISTTGSQSHGIYLQNKSLGDVTATFSGDTISTAGDGSHGVFLEPSLSGSAQFSGNVNSVTTGGNGAYGIYTTNQNTGGAGNSAIDFMGGNVTISGGNAYGLYAEALGTGTADVTMNANNAPSSVNVSGSGSYGVSAYSQGNTTTLSLDAATITATGNAQAAVGFAERASAGQAATQANITFGDSLVIDASGSNNQFAFYNADDQAGTNMNLTTTGTVTGSAVMGGGNSNFTLAGGSWTGNIYGDFDPNGTPAVNQGVDNFVWSGGTLNSGFYGQGGNDTALISVTESPSFPNAILDGGENGGAPESRISADFDQITFAANNSSLAGRNITNWEDFTVNENVALRFIDDGIAIDGYDGGNTNGFGDFNMLAGSKVTAGAGRGQSFNLGGNLVNQGVLSMQDGAYGGNIIVGGDYDSKKGRLAIDVDFGALQSDVLTLGGKVDGVTAIDIADVGTSGSLGSILIVDMSNSSAVDQNEFVIEDEKNNTTAVGIYAYSLEYDLDGDPAGYAPGLYLTSVNSDNPSNPTNPNNPNNPNGPVTPTPQIQPYVPLYEGYQSVVSEMNQLGTMRQRVGKRYWVYDAPMAAPVSIKSAPAEPAPYQRPNEKTPDMQNIWGRVDGGFAHVDPQSVTYDYKYDLSHFGVQTGIDGLFIDNGSGRLISGLTAHYRDGEAKFKSIYGDSKLNIDGWGIGGTVTWYGDNGFYADGQAEATWYSSELKAEDLQRGIDNSDAFGYALSMEAGKQIGFGDKMIFTPQGQLVWSSTDIESFTGAYSDDVEFNNGDSLTARLGVALERENNWYETTGLSRHSNIYGIANLYYDFDSTTKATIEQVYVAETDLGGLSGEIGFGGTYDWQDSSKRSYGVYGEVSASMGFESGTYGYAGNLGFRFKW